MVNQDKGWWIEKEMKVDRDKQITTTKREWMFTEVKNDEDTEDTE